MQGYIKNFKNLMIIIPNKSDLKRSIYSDECQAYMYDIYNFYEYRFLKEKASF